MGDGFVRGLVDTKTEAEKTEADRKVRQTVEAILEAVSVPVQLGGGIRSLPDIERWIEANGYRTNGAPWEWYVTDPGQHPNPADWRTDAEVNEVNKPSEKGAKVISAPSTSPA